MKLDHERQMFLSAMAFAITCTTGATRLGNVAWADDHVDFRSATSSAHVLWPKGTKFKNPACVVWCGQKDRNMCDMLGDFDPTTVKYVHGRAYYFFKEGQHVMAELGAIPSIRCKQESQVLR